MSTWHAVILSVLQGAFELFPVSSLGHTVLVPALFNWNERQSDPSFLAFVVVLHLGTALALLIFFWRDWLAVITAVLRSIGRRQLSSDPNEHLGWLIVAGSIPAGILGLLFKQRLNDLFDRPWLVAAFLLANGFVLLLGERLRAASVAAAEGRDLSLSTLGLPKGVAIGAAQALALLPGFSRSGTSMVGGLVVRLTHIDAAKLSFMLATPLIFAAGALSVPDLFKDDANIGPGLAAMGFVISGVTAFFAIRFLMRYLTTERLDVFGYYCIAFATVALVVLGVRAA